MKGPPGVSPGGPFRVFGAGRGGPVQGHRTTTRRALRGRAAGPHDEGMSSSTPPLRSVLTAAEGGPALRYERVLAFPAERVWAACSTDAGLSPWIGALRGSASAGDLAFAMTAEGAEAPWVPVEVAACAEASGWDVRLDAGMGAWRFVLSLAAHPDGTLLRFEHRMDSLDELRPYGTGWDYYLDRLELSLSGGEIASVDFVAVNDALAPVFEELFAEAEGRG